MNMIKKIAMGMGAFGLVASMVGCGDSGGGSVSDLTFTEKSKGVWAVDGTVMADNNIFDVKFQLKDKDGKAVEGAVYAYTVKDVNPDTTQPLTELNIGAGVGTVPGLATEIFQSDMKGACGTMTFTVTAIVEGSGAMGGANGEAVELEPVEGTFEVACGDTTKADTAAIEVPTITLGAALDSATIDLGGVKSTMASSFDLDAGKAYKSAELTTPDLKNSIDMIFSGTKIMTPFGTTSAAYMTKTFSGINNGAGIIKVDAAKAAAATKIDDLAPFLDGEVVSVSAIAQGDAFLIITDKVVPVLVIATKLDATAQVLSIKYLK